MDVLKFIALLPLKIIYFFSFILFSLGNILGVILKPLLGSWQAPKWASKVAENTNSAKTWTEKYPYKASGAIFAAVLIIAGGFSFYQWHLTRPTPTLPEMVTFSISEPSIRDFTNENSTPTHLGLSFSKSAAPIENIDKEIKKGIKISPPVDGTWKWFNDRYISFSPKVDWVPGEEYTVSINPTTLLAPQVLIEQSEETFTATPMTASLSNSYFYTDPIDPSLQRAISDVYFNYPVDPAQFEKHISLTLKEQGEKDSSPSFNVTYDEFKLKAVIQSDALSMPEKDSMVIIELDKGIAASMGGNKTTDQLVAEVTVPSIYSLKINSISATLINNSNNEPEQIIMIETSNPVQDKSMNSRVKAWILSEPPEGEDPWNYGSLTPEMLKEKGTPLKLTPIPSEEEYSSLHSYRFEAKPLEAVYVRIEQDIKSFSGYKLATPRYQMVEVPEFPTLLDFVSEGSLLSLSGDHKLTVVSRNNKGIELTIRRVIPAQIQNLVSQNQRDYVNPEFNYYFGEDNITEVFEAKIPIPNPSPITPHYEGFDLSPFFGPKGKDLRGVFLVSLQSYDPDEEALEAKDTESNQQKNDFYGEEEGSSRYNDDDGYGYYDDSDSVRRMIVVTDLGIIAKTSHDKSRDVYVQSIHTGQPVPWVNVSVLALNGEELLSATTDEDGHVSFPSLENYSRERKPTLFVVDTETDTSFLPISDSSRSLSYSRFDSSGDSTPEAGALKAHMFSDRGIYRPGDTFHIGLIVRAFDWNKSLVGLPFELSLYDPRGQLVQSSKITLSPEGFEEYTYTTRPTDATGEWGIYLYLIKDEEKDIKSFIGHTEIEVKEFLPDQIQVKASFSAEKVKGWVKPDGLDALVNVQNLFGTPAQDRLVEGEITLRPALPTFTDYADYTFRSRNDNREGLSEPLPEQLSDEQGNAIFKLELAPRVEGTYQLYFLTRAFMQGSGRNVAAQASILVSPEDFLVGIKPDGDLGYIDRGVERSLNLIALNQDLEKVAARELKLVLKEKKYLSVLTKDQYSGIYSYESKPRVDELSARTLSIPASGENIALPTDQPGNFLIQIQDKEGKILNWIEYSVAGDANITRSLERSAELQLKLNKKTFEPGEIIEIAINAPYTGSGLITIERDQVYAQTWFISPTTSSVQQIRVPDDFVGNGYINVQFVRDPNSTEIFISPLSYGVLPFNTTLDSKRAEVEVEVPPLLKPGDDLTMRISTPQPEKVVVFAVDEGILQVARYDLEDPLSTLMPKRSLEVKTSQILDLILPMFKTILAQSAPGGDASDTLLGHLNPFARKVDAPVAYWSGIIEVDGEKELVYEIPDYFNGKIRVMAVAVTQDGVGIFQTSSVVRGDLIMTPNVPAMVSPGDTFEITLGVANNMENLGDTEVPISISLTTEEGLEIVESDTSSLNLGEKKEGFVSFKLKANKKVGASKLTFHANYNNKNSRRSAEISVLPSEVYRTEVTLGRMDNEAIQLSNLREMYDEFAVREVSASYVPMVMARGLASYLTNYPHYCSEQLISSAIPHIVQERHPEFELVETDLFQGREHHSKILAVLATRQNSIGGIGSWEATPEANPFVTAYAVNYLLELKQNSISVPESMLTNANDYLHAYAINPAYNELEQLRLKAYITYLFARQQQIPTNLLAAVSRDMNKFYPKELETDLAGTYMAATYKIVKQDKEADKLIKHSVKTLSRTNPGEWNSSEYYDNLVRDASILYILESYFPQQAGKIPTEALENITQPLIDNRFNTLSSALSILALDKYASRALVQDAEITISQANTQDINQSTVISTVSGLLSEADFDSNAKLILLKKSTPLPAWYAMEQAGFDLNPSTTPIKDGLEVFKEYYNANGELVDEVKLGQKIFVVIKVRSTSRDYIPDAVLVDLLPGGFEMVNEDNEALPIPEKIAALTSASLDIQHLEEREDRALIYCSATPDLTTTYYVIRATNEGEFIIPALYGESMYDRTIQARSPGGEFIKVVE